jgi:hypothetical protein
LVEGAPMRSPWVVLAGPRNVAQVPVAATRVAAAQVASATVGVLLTRWSETS